MKLSSPRGALQLCAKSRHYAVQANSRLFDHLVGTGE